MAINTKTVVLYIQVSPNGKVKLLYNTQLIRKGVVIFEEQQSLVANDPLEDLDAKIAAENTKLTADEYPALKPADTDLFKQLRALVKPAI